jgi:hypothetical protein
MEVWSGAGHSTTSRQIRWLGDLALGDGADRRSANLAVRLP